MLAVYDLYGSRSLSLVEVSAAVQRAVGIEMGRRDSHNMGGTYFRGGVIGDEEFVVQLNHDEDPEPLEPDFDDYKTLLRINRSERADDLRRLLQRIPDLDFLRRTTYNRADHRQLTDVDVFESDRDFQLWRAGVGHQTLLLRATKTKEHPTRIDLVFKPVYGMKLIHSLNGIKVAAAPPDQAARICLELAMAANRQVFLVESGDFHGYIAANVAFITESEREYHEPNEVIGVVRGKLKGLDTAAIPSGDIHGFRPEDPTNFSIPVTASIGPANGEGAELFQLTIRSPGYVEPETAGKGFAFERGTLILERWDPDLAERAIGDLCRRTEGYFWQEVAQRLTRYLLWEFEDYQEPFV